MRLIDADALKRDLKSVTLSNGTLVNANTILALLDKYPTAYDPDKVGDQLNGKIKELKDISCCIVLDKERKAQNRGYYAAMNHAIEIVKGGGMNG